MRLLYLGIGRGDVASDGSTGSRMPAGYLDAHSVKHLCGTLAALSVHVACTWPGEAAIVCVIAVGCVKTGFVQCLCTAHATSHIHKTLRVMADRMHAAAAPPPANRCTATVPQVVGVYSREVLLNAGNVHCITQQWVAPK